MNVFSWKEVKHLIPKLGDVSFIVTAQEFITHSGAACSQANILFCTPVFLAVIEFITNGTYLLE